MTITRLATLLAVSLALGACGGGGGRDDHPADADSGQAAPATTVTPNNPSAPDSTTGVSPNLSGTPAGNQPGVAGDTLGSRAPGGARPGGTPQNP